MLNDYGAVFNLACFLNDADYSESQGGSSTAVAVSLAACFSNRCFTRAPFSPLAHTVMGMVCRPVFLLEI